MKHSLLFLLLAPAVSLAQIQITPVPANPPLQVWSNPGSQANSPQATLRVHGSLARNGSVLFQNQSIMGALAPSVTMPWVSQLQNPQLTTFTFHITIEGAPNLPFALLATATAGPFSCGGGPTSPVGGGCVTSAWLPGAVSFPSGIYHLDGAPGIILDSLGIFTVQPSAPFLNTNGRFTLGAVIGLGPLAPQGGSHLATQAVVGDPTSPTGFRLSGAFVVTEYWQ